MNGVALQYGINDVKGDQFPPRRAEGFRALGACSAKAPF